MLMEVQLYTKCLCPQKSQIYWSKTNNPGTQDAKIPLGFLSIASAQMNILWIMFCLNSKISYGEMLEAPEAVSFSVTL